MNHRIELTPVKCCATCKQSAGWMDNMHCTRHRIGVKPYLICNDFDIEKSITLTDEIGSGANAGL